MFTPTNPPAELMKLCQPEAVRALNEHNGRIGHVYANFNDGCRDQDIELPLGEQRHGGIFLLARHPPMQQPQLKLGEDARLQPLILLHGCFRLHLV